MIIAPAALLAACAIPTEDKRAEVVIGMPNPASQYCVEQGGRLEMKQDEQGGVYGVCHLPDGRVIEEWSLFRSQH